MFIKLHGIKNHGHATWKIQEALVFTIESMVLNLVPFAGIIRVSFHTAFYGAVHRWLFQCSHWVTGGSHRRPEDHKFPSPILISMRRLVRHHHNCHVASCTSIVNDTIFCVSRIASPLVRICSFKEALNLRISGIYKEGYRRRGLISISHFLCSKCARRNASGTNIADHYVVLYYSGEQTDCKSPNCGLSSVHMHKTARNCPCPKVYKDQRRVLNLIQEPCDACKEAALAARVTRRW